MNGRTLSYLLITAFFVANWGVCSACNQPPVAQIDHDVTPWEIYVTAGTTVVLDGSDSYDPDGYIQWYRWTLYRWNGSYYAFYASIWWDDPVYEYEDTFDEPGSYIVELDVQDDDDAWSYYSDSSDVLAVTVTIDDYDEYLAYGGAGEAEIDYTLEPEDGGFRRAVKLIVKDDGGSTVKTVNLEDDLGSQYTTWDGTDDSDEPVEPGEYTAIIQMGVGYGPSDYFSDSCTITIVKVTMDYCPDITYYAYRPTPIFFTMEPDCGSYPHSGSLYIADSGSQTIFVEDLGETLGSQEYRWNGKKSDGTWAPPDDYTVTVELQVGSGGSIIFSDSCSLTILPSVTKVQYDDPGTGWTDVGGTLCVRTGTTVSFRAVPNPTGASWPSGQPVWSGTSGATGTGETVSVAFSTLSSTYTGNPPDYKTVKAQNGNSATANVIVYDFEGNLTPQDNFAGRSTEHYGIAELVNLGYSTDPAGIPAYLLGGLEWTIADGVGLLSNVNISLGTATYNARYSAGQTSLRITVNSGPSKDDTDLYTREVILPSETRMTRVDGTVWHIQGRASAGLALYYWLDPKDVSFSNLTFGEGSCPATDATGIYLNPSPGDHPENTFGPIIGGNISTGCRVLYNDHAWTNYAEWGDGGTFTWNIPSQYIDNMGVRHTFGSGQVHNPTIEPNGTTTMRKGGHSGTAAVNDPSVGWP